MRVIVCLDDKGGMMFNHRRQSRDRVLIADVLSDLGDNALWISPYSASLFDASRVSLSVSEDFLHQADTNATCFVEDRALMPYGEKIDSVVIYRWNRHYPGDLFCDLDPIALGLRLTARSEFAGSSHETITKEIYQR